MKLNRTHLFITITSLALVAVLIIQINWIVETAKIREELFSEKANMVLSRTTEALSLDTVLRRKMESGLDRTDVQKIDSLFIFYMKFYNFHIDYYFEVKPGLNTNTREVISYNIYPREAGCYKKSFDEIASKNGFELKLIFPEKEDFIMQEMGLLFITSVFLILVVLVLFWQTILSLLKQKKISQHTTDFLNNMTHEFKTPLTNIALAGKMITKEASLKQEDKIKHYTGIILEENEKLRFQVEQVLNMTALERGEIPLQKTELDLHQLIHDCLKCISVQIENKQGNLTLELNATEYILAGDKLHLSNALCNLIDNAIKYSKEKPELTIKTMNEDGMLILVVSDRGIGIEEEYREKVFDKFFRVPTGDVHDVKGFGLGLAYIKKIIELHNGSVTLTSKKGEGTTFKISLHHV